MTVAVQLNGQGPFRFMVDTGASTVAISQAITVSIGVASARCHADLPAELWMAEADRQLYASKQRGRDCITTIQFDAQTCHGYSLAANE